jgi:hypothetical protein
VTLALRIWLYFDGTNARDLYLQVTSQLYTTYALGDKPQFTAPCWFHPAGGGLYGFDNGGLILNHGHPSQAAILRLARPVIIPVRQNITVDAQFFAVGATNVLDIINAAATDDQMVIMYVIDGQLRRLSLNLPQTGNSN